MNFSSLLYIASEGIPSSFGLPLPVSNQVNWSILELLVNALHQQIIFLCREGMFSAERIKINRFPRMFHSVPRDTESSEFRLKDGAQPTHITRIPWSPATNS